MGGGWVGRCGSGQGGKGGGAMRGMPDGKRRVSEALGSERLAEMEVGPGHDWLRQLVERAEEQWWCGACRELRTQWELDAFERAGQMLFVCLACGEIVEAIPF